jgi:prepilin-type N-terminal cleavage/methylation domain-containing protein
MLNRLRNRQRGFTLIELLIVVAIIGIIAALLIPNFLDALQKAKQKRTVADMRNVGTAEMSWLTDQIAAAAAGAAVTTINLGSYSTITVAALETRLIPQYIQDIPQVDGWKNNYWFALDVSDPGGPAAMAITSGGANGKTTAAPSTGTITPSAFDPTDYDQDIIWADGFFVRWPQKVTN